MTKEQQIIKQLTINFNALGSRETRIDGAPSDGDIIGARYMRELYIGQKIEASKREELYFG